MRYTCTTPATWEPKRRESCIVTIVRRRSIAAIPKLRLKATLHFDTFQPPLRLPLVCSLVRAFMASRLALDSPHKKNLAHTTYIQTDTKTLSMRPSRQLGCTRLTARSHIQVHARVLYGESENAYEGHFGFWHFFSAPACS